MAKIIKAAVETAFSGAFGYRALGLHAEQVCMLAGGAVHTVAYSGARSGNKTIPGAIITDWDPDKEQVWGYSEVRRALQKAGTEERLYGTIDLVGGAGEMTRLGTELGRIKTMSVTEWVKKYAFEGIDPEQVIEAHKALYAEVNAD